MPCQRNQILISHNMGDSNTGNLLDPLLAESPHCLPCQMEFSQDTLSKTILAIPSGSSCVITCCVKCCIRLLALPKLWYETHSMMCNDVSTCDLEIASRPPTSLQSSWGATVEINCSWCFFRLVSHSSHLIVSFCNIVTRYIGVDGWP